MSSQGVYGTKVPAIINPSTDIEIYYNYRPTRNDDSTINSSFQKLDSTLLIQATIGNSDQNIYDNILEGMYNLKLPLRYFNEKGFYTVYIKPKEYPMVIQDISTLVTYPDVRGLIIDTSKLPSDLQNMMLRNNSLVGYRIIYFDENNKRQPYYRLITSNNKCEPVVQNLPDTNQKAVRYRYNESSNLVFITLTPSTAPSFKSNAEPFIGNISQKIVLTNTLFEPIMLDLELVDKDAETISTMIEGSQLRDLDHGLITTFNKNNEIYHQSEHYSIKDSYTQRPIFEVKRQRNNSIDFTQTLDGK